MADEYGPAAIDFDLVSAISRTMNAYSRMAPRPLGPMIVPDWLPDSCREHDIDIDAVARSYGFDGYVTASASLRSAPE